jgi:hypothetical protein
MRHVVAFLFLLCVITSAEASYIQHSNGYYYLNGYSQPYTQSYSWYPAGFYPGYGYASAGYYTSYTPYYGYVTPTYAYSQPATNNTYNISPSNPDWRAEGVKLLKARDEAKAFSEFTGLLNQQPGYNYSAPYNHAYGGYVPQGNTVYGYSTKNLLELYGDGSVNTAVLSYAQAVKNAQAGAVSAVDGLGVAVKDLSANQTRLMEILLQRDGNSKEILASGAAAAQAITAAKGSSARLETTTTVTGQQSVKPAPAMPAAVDPLPSAVSQVRQQIINRSCLSCHGANNPKAGLNLSSYDSLSQDVKDAIFECVNASDSKCLMPKGASRLPIAERKLFGMP